MQLKISRLSLSGIVWLAAFLCYGVSAQSFSEHEKQIKQGMDRLQEQIAPLMKREDVFLQPPGTADTATAVADENEPCFPVQHIDVSGIALFSARTVSPLLRQYENRCLSMTAINTLISRLSGLYLEHGYVTSRAYIGPQDLSDGTLELQVLEGMAEELRSADGSISAKQLSLAFPLKPGSHLNLRDIEQGVENLNTLGSNQVTTELEPGLKQGGSTIMIYNSPSRRWRGSAGLSNTGSDSTGKYQLDANLVADNLLGVNDTVFFSGSGNVGGHDLPQAKSRSYALSWSVPVGYWQVSLLNNYYEYEQTVVGNVVNFLTHGSSFNSTAQLLHTFYRGQADKLDFSLAFNRKESRNYIEDIFLETSSRTLYVWNFGADYLLHLPEGSITAGVQVYHSVPWFGAKQQLVAAEDDFQFTKYQLNLGFSTDFSMGEQPVRYNASLEWLYSREELLASEGIAVGGRYSVRGLSDGGLFGYKGGYLRNDFTFPAETGWDVLNQMQWYWGIDAGITNLPEFSDKGSGWVAGTAIGLRLYDRRFTVNLSYARALRVPDFLKQKQQEIDFSVRYSF
ncbi:ShlB/FhaC/HecB family hemolysin secretion/activation protein [Chromatiaceae bacterium AAb-1]|nr:ShlB/FhaC/HecB family hemolysin secretion/activation protein [Chromatiaceae bacterium AAb-1]